MFASIASQLFTICIENRPATRLPCAETWVSKSQDGQETIRV